MGKSKRFRDGAVAMALVAGISVGLTGLAAPAQAATTTITLTGPSSNYQGVSTKLTATWKVAGKGHQGTVTVQQRVNGKWYALGTVKTSSSGHGTIGVKPHATSVFRARTSSVHYSKDKTLTIKAPYAISAKASPTSVTKGKTSKLIATYTNRGKKVSSATLTLYLEVHSKWKKHATVHVRNGVATRTLRPSSTHHYRLTAGKKATSRTITVTVHQPKPKVPTSFTIHGSGYGHGVGMPQYGAYDMALNGYSAPKILTTYYRGTKVSNLTTPPTIAVQVWGPDPYGYPAGEYSDTAKSTSVHINTGTWRLRSAHGTTLYSGPAPVTVTIGVKSGKVTAKFSVKKGSKTTKKTYKDSTLRIHWSGTSYYRTSHVKALATIHGAHGEYRGGRFTITNIGGQPNIVNDLKLNTEYLYGIAEMPSSWGLGKGKAALEAQAIVARSYALQKMKSKNSRCHCNVVDDIRDQNFTGWYKQDEGTNRYYGKIWDGAVKATESSSTRAKALTYGGKVIAAHYYSSSGGRTASSQDVWSAKVPYEQSVSDPWSLKAPGNSMRSWTRTLSQSTTERIFGLSHIKSVSVAHTYSSGQMRTVTATSTSGKKRSVTGKADAMRAKFGLPGGWVSAFHANS